MPNQEELKLSKKEKELIVSYRSDVQGMTTQLALARDTLATKQIALNDLMLIMMERRDIKEDEYGLDTKTFAFRELTTEEKKNKIK